MNNKIRCTCFEIVQQLNYYSIDKLNESLENNKSIINNYAYAIHHEQDNIHFHCMIKFNEQFYITDIAKRFDIPVQCIEKPKKTGKYQYLYMCQYLIHMNDIEKEQIDPSQVVSNFDYIKYIDFKIETQNKIDTNIEFVDNLVRWIQGKKSTYDMCILYGRDFIKNMTKYSDGALAITNALSKDKEDIF